MNFDSEIHEGYLMATLDIIKTIFKNLLTVNDIRWVMSRLNQWCDDEIKHRTYK